MSKQRKINTQDDSFVLCVSPRILNTAKATRTKRDEVAKKAKELETKVPEVSGQPEKIQGIDAKRFQELEQLAQTYKERKLEEQQRFLELKERWSGEKTTLQQEIEQLKESL